MSLSPSRRSQIASFIAMDVFRQANLLAHKGADIIHLEVGQPTVGAPRKVREAALHALEHDQLSYTDATGQDALRERLVQHYADTYGVLIPSERIILTTGSSAGFILSFLGLFDAGGRVGLFEPGYPAYRNILQALDLAPVSIGVRAESQFRPTPAHLEGAGTLDGLLLASPSNPTGTMLHAHELEALVTACVDRNIALISDEIYHGITFEGAAPSALQFSDDVVVVNSFSKYYAMTGWRLGWMIVPDALIDPVIRLQQNLFISPPTLPQIAALAAFDATDELEENCQTYAANRALLLEALPGLGFGEIAPVDGAFYMYIDVSGRTDDAAEFAKAMLHETGVAVTPGVDFDPDQGHHFIRLCFARATPEIEQAIERLSRWLQA